MTPDGKEEIQRRILDKHLDRIERMLKECIKADPQERKERRKQQAISNERLKALEESQKKLKEAMNKHLRPPDKDS
jgi:hypothetical protein